MLSSSPKGASFFDQRLAQAARPRTGGQPDYTPTPDRRYFVVRGRLWRLSNPFLDAGTHERLVRDLMNARRAIAHSTTRQERISARLRVDAAKRALGERGDPWWADGSPDYNRKLAINTPYAAWFTQAD
jgi:hypothetical protein